MPVAPETEPENNVDVAQQNRGRDIEGGGEWPDRDAPPRGPAPGTTVVAGGVNAERADVPHRENPRDAVSEEQAASGAIPDDQTATPSQSQPD